MRPRRHLPLVSLLALAAAIGGVLTACGRGAVVRAPEGGTFRVTGVGANVDPTLHGARLVPEVVDESTTYGTESGGGTRVITAGLRIVTARDGAIAAAEDRLPQPPALTTALPERLGGGFLFVLGSTLWRSDHWLDAARPIFTSFQSIHAIVPGLDRVYLKAQNAYMAIDGKTGAVLDLGPWPASPFVSSYAAADGWRAAAVTDLRGVVATFDAGATWRTLDLPMEARQVLASGDALAVGGIENAKNEAWFEVRGDGTIARLSGPPREAKGKLLPTPIRPSPYPTFYPGTFPPPHVFSPVPVPVPVPGSTARGAAGGGERDELAQDAGVRIFGKRPLAAAIEDGWPLTDGTAVVARDGALGRVRLSDGALVEVASGAFPLKPARCHPVSLTRKNAIGAFGFVCGEPRGTTAIYAYDPMRGSLAELKRFDRPRVVSSSGNGAIAVRGPCAEDADPNAAPREPTRIPVKDTDAGASSSRLMVDLKLDAKPEGNDAGAVPPEPEKPSPPAMHPFCVLGHDNTWREVHVRGDVGGERVVVLADGKIAVVSPPQGPTAVARLTLLDNGKPTTVPITFPRVAADIARVLRLGVWLDGFEERRPGVLGGWIEAGGAMLGIEIALDGNATPGQFVRDAGMPFVSGRYGLGWSPTKRGYETTDGGMTWTSIELPEPVVPITKVDRRACGPIGCLAAGWLRIGWGEPKKPQAPAIPPPYRPMVSASAPIFNLACEPMDAAMPAPPAPRTKVAATPPPVATFQPGLGGLRRPPSPSAVLATAGGAPDLPAFFSQAGPLVRDTDRGLSLDVQDMPDPNSRGQRLGVLARVYAWGPKTGEWETQGKWQVKWLSLFAGWPEAKSSIPVLPPQIVIDSSRSGSSAYGSPFSSYSSYSFQGLFQIVPGDDAAHALLVTARSVARTEWSPMELEADRAPVEVKRADGEPFVAIEAATRTAGRWFIATPSPAGTTPPVTTIWQIDGAIARELVRIPRAALDTNRPTGTRLARRSDGRAIGLVVDGQATAERNTQTRWVLPIDLESGQVGEPEPLGYADLGGRTIDACTDDIVGFVYDVPLGSASVRLKIGASNGSMHSTWGRVRLTPTRACIERVAGMFDGQTAERAAVLMRTRGAPSTTAIKPGEIVASAFASQSRFALRCTLTR